jgi:hypothetical protein
LNEYYKCGNYAENPCCEIERRGEEKENNFKDIWPDPGSMNEEPFFI